MRRLFAGTALRATRPIHKGETVISEKPMLQSAPAQGDDAAAAQLQAFCDAAPETRAAVLALFTGAAASPRAQQPPRAHTQTRTHTHPS